MTRPPLRIAIAGLGTVGIGVIRMIELHSSELSRKTGREIKIVAVHARDRAKRRTIDISRYQWIEKPLNLIDAADVIVELIGGADGIAKELIEKALRAGKSVVTANKALLARHGYALAALSQETKASLGFEASVAGGIPIIKTLREGFAGNRIEGVYGILNGTCNYILTEMRETGRDFQDVLADAQAKGYAEADPGFDIDGIDAAHKLSILTALSFGTKPSFESIDITGIRAVSQDDIKFAEELGLRIKLLGIAARLGDRISQRLEPCLVPVDCPLGSVEGVFNAVMVTGDFVGNAMLEGRGAGEGPTASAVLSDLVDLARETHLPMYGMPVEALTYPLPADDIDIIKENYVHLRVLDQPGVIADVSGILRDFGISIETMIQRGRAPGQPVSVVITTHECSKARIREAMEKIARLASVVEKPSTMPIERFV